MDVEPGGAAVESAGVGGNLGRWARRRARQALILVAALAFAAVMVVVGAFLERAIGLMGLPDPGDPFDVAAFAADRPPEDRDAFAYYRRAWSLLERRLGTVDLSRAMRESIPTQGWSTADPEVREWAEARREPLELFLTGAAQADGWAHPAPNESSLNCYWFQFEPLVHLALLDAARLEEAGDMPGAWARYRAILSVQAQVSRRGTAIERQIAGPACGPVRPRIKAWAEDPRTSLESVRQALEVVKSLAPRPEWEASSLKTEYLLVMNELDRPEGVLTNFQGPDRLTEFFGIGIPPNAWNVIHAIRRFRLNEPERSRRVARLSFANWLAHFGQPLAARGKPVTRVRRSWNGNEPGLLLYGDGPPSSRPIAPRALGEWILAAADFQMMQSWWTWSAYGETERHQHGGVLVDLAGELFRRERGAPPAKEADLVGPYLEALPDGSSDLDNLPETLDDLGPKAPDGR